MLRVTIEVLPGGDSARALVLRTVTIENRGFVSLGSGGNECEYVAKLSNHEIENCGRLGTFRHNQTDSVEKCVGLALRAVGR